MLVVISVISGLVGIAVAAISVIFLAVQTKAVARQTAISNALAGVTVLNGTAEALRAVFAVFLERPELRAYFYEKKPGPSRGRDKVRVQTIADMLADALEDGHLATELVPSSESNDDWDDYCQYMLGVSPVLADLVCQHPKWWPHLYRIVMSNS